TMSNHPRSWRARPTAMVIGQFSPEKDNQPKMQCSTAPSISERHRPSILRKINKLQHFSG
ncbi:hypothetical protein, partial [Synechococcus sp. W60.2]|uniref:hypothetical protein n=1 Tax=Synechococcus sp. W60.2 TaxID=2964521 RepID=UPI0039C3292A